MHRWKEAGERKSLTAALRAELEIFARATKSNSEIDFKHGGSLLVPKSLPEPKFYLSSISRISLLPELSANKVIIAYSIIEEYPHKIRYTVSVVRESELNPTTEHGEVYIVRSSDIAKRVSEMHKGLYEYISSVI